MKIRRGLSLSLAIFLCCILAGCLNPVLSVDTSRLSPLEVRAIETRTYDGQDTKATLKTVLNVLQDEGFLVDYGNTDLGLLHACKTIGNTVDKTFDSSLADLGSLTRGLPASSIAVIEATANVSDFGNQTKVRINFQQKVISPTGIVNTAVPVSNPKTYQEFFAKLDRGLFIQKQGL